MYMAGYINNLNACSCNFNILNQSLPNKLVKDKN